MRAEWHELVRRAAAPGISLADQVNPEAHVMKRIQSVGFGAHPNLIGFKGHWRHESPAPEDPVTAPRAVASFVDYLVLEAAEGGDLFARVRSRGALPEPEAREHFLQLALGLHALHQWVYVLHLVLIALLSLAGGGKLDGGLLPYCLAGVAAVCYVYAWRKERAASRGRR